MNVVNMIRGGSFASALIIFTLLQTVIPSRKFEKGRWKYSISNLFLVGFNNLFLGLLPIIPYQMAVTAEDRSWGLLNLMEFPMVVSIILGILILDVTIYFQHRLFHQVHFLWRLHSMHHIDPMLDTTSGLRFHPFEIIISNFIKVTIIMIMGISPLTVIIFEIALNVLSMFNHSNIKIHTKIEKVLNKLLITPAIHTIHHSKIFTETNSNYGFSVPWWDMLFKTFTLHGKYPQEKINIGIPNMPEPKYQRFPYMLIQPFLKGK